MIRKAYVYLWVVSVLLGEYPDSLCLWSKVNWGLNIINECWKNLLNIFGLKVGLSCIDKIYYYVRNKWFHIWFIWTIFNSFSIFVCYCTLILMEIMLEFFYFILGNVSAFLVPWKYVISLNILFICRQNYWVGLWN